MNLANQDTRLLTLCKNLYASNEQQDVEIKLCHLWYNCLKPEIFVDKSLKNRQDLTLKNDNTALREI